MLHTVRCEFLTVQLIAQTIRQIIFAVKEDECFIWVSIDVFKLILRTILQHLTKRIFICSKVVILGLHMK